MTFIQNPVEFASEELTRRIEESEAMGRGKAGLADQFALAVEIREKVMRDAGEVLLVVLNEEDNFEFRLA